MALRFLAGVLAAAGLLTGACADGDEDAASDHGGGPAPTAEVEPGPRGDEPAAAPTAEVESGPRGDGPAASPDSGGWIGGEPDWYGGADDGSRDTAGIVDRAGSGDTESSESMSEMDAPASADEDVAGIDGDVYARDDGGTAYEVREASTGPLIGGSIDDNERFEDYLAYRARFQGLNIAVRDLDPSGRIIVTVTGDGGLPAAGAEVVASGGGVQVPLRATADGTVRFHPGAYGGGDGPFTITAGGVSVEAARGESVTLETGLQTAGEGPVALDILFLLDATGSMGDEIDQLKSTIAEVVRRLEQLPTGIDLRLGMTLYRDEGDSFVTSTFDFTSDTDAFGAALAAVVADGGGDEPEALDEALAEALAAPAWRPAAETLQLVILVADAAPQIGRDVPVPYTMSMLEAVERGVKILPISSSGTNDQAEYVFRQLAQFTGARYVFLSYGVAGRATGGSSDITAVDYEELSLDDLIVRLIAEELAALTGADDIVPVPAPVETPVQGQSDG